MERLKEKYIELLLKKCINFNNSKSLFISYEAENIDFVSKLVVKAKEVGINDIYLYRENTLKKHEILKDISFEELNYHPTFNKIIWDDYAFKNASFLILQSEYPGLMDDIDPLKLAQAKYIDLSSRPNYQNLQYEFQIPWCIAPLPSKRWAKKLFPNLNEEDAYNKLFVLICEMSMADTKNPQAAWDNFLTKQRELQTKLNSLEISQMHYKNNLGTDLYLEITPNTNWCNVSDFGKDMMVNFPSYEIFTNPNFRRTNGVVFGSRPICYNGLLIKDFYLEFKDGKVVNYKAKEGQELLTKIIRSDEYSSYLGEVALVDNNNPITQTNMIYDSTILDENASCHLALGNGFSECVNDYKKMSRYELLKIGVNPSKIHVDFMIGTPDLSIEANTNKGKKFVFKNGSFNI